MTNYETVMMKDLSPHQCSRRVEREQKNEVPEAVFGPMLSLYDMIAGAR